MWSDSTILFIVVLFVYSILWSSLLCVGVSLSNKSLKHNPHIETYSEWRHSLILCKQITTLTLYPPRFGKKNRENISILIEFIKVKCKRSVKTEQCKINTIQKEIIFKPFIYLLRHRSNQKHKTEWVLHKKHKFLVPK